MDVDKISPIEMESTRRDGSAASQQSSRIGSEAEFTSDAEKGHVELPVRHAYQPGRFIDSEAEKRLVRKIDFRLLPLLMALYLLASLDRSNIGNAYTAGMREDLNLSSADYNWLLTIFYIAYIVFEWGALCYKLFPPHIWATFCVLGWGIAATAQAGTTSWAGLLAARFFLGAFEAFFSPGIVYLLSFFYLRHELGFRCGLYLSAAPLATCFAGALAYGITKGKPEGIAPWRLLFLVEGLPTVLMAGVTFFFLPDSPAKARFLNAEEKLIVEARGVRQVGKEEAHATGSLSGKDVVAALLDLKNWLTALMYFSCNVSFSSLPVFLPTILQEMGFTSINAQGLSAPPYFLAFLLVIGTCYIADRTQQRGITIIILSLVGFVGYVLLSTTTSVGARYAGVFLAAAGIFPSIGNILPWVLNNQGSDTKRGMGIAILNIVGQCGPLLGTNSFPGDDKPFYRRGMWTCAAFMLFNAFLALALRTLLVWENKKLDRKYGNIKRDEGVFAVGCENDGPNFRYVL